MGISAAVLDQYKNSIRKLFPQGEYWDRQFADDQSDASVFVKAKLQSLERFRLSMKELHNESRIESAELLLGDWERVMLGGVNHGLDTEQRRGILLAANAGSFNIESIRKTGRLFGITIADVRFPLRPAFFAHCRFGVDRMASPAAFSVLFVYASGAEQSVRDEFEKKLLSTMLANYIVHFIYGGK
ncbi:MAG: hypothetical protein FWD91_06450 [Treponema sp.]|nr:hypothetical protein [Treponema sp.]